MYFIMKTLFVVDRIALIFTIIGAINLGILGILRYDVMHHVLGGNHTTMSRVLMTLIGISAIWAISLLFRRMDRVD